MTNKEAKRRTSDGLADPAGRGGGGGLGDETELATEGGERMALALVMYVMAPVLLMVYFAWLIRKPPRPSKRQRVIMDIGKKTAGMGLQDIEERSKRRRDVDKG